MNNNNRNIIINNNNIRNNNIRNNNMFNFDGSNISINFNNNSNILSKYKYIIIYNNI